MTVASLLAAVSAIVETVREAPQLVSAVEEVFAALRSKEDPAPAMRRLEAAAAAHELGIPWP
jgi:hypothetical protein